MRIYFHGAYKRLDVAAAEPIIATEDEAKRIFAHLGDAGSFLGIILGANRILQLYRQADGTLHAEILKEEQLATRYCTVNVPLAELLVEAAFRKEDFEQKIAFARITWNDDTLKRA